MHTLGTKMVSSREPKFFNFRISEKRITWKMNIMVASKYIVAEILNV